MHKVIRKVMAESCFAFGAHSTLCIFGIALVSPHPTNFPVNSFRPWVNSEMQGGVRDSSASWASRRKSVRVVSRVKARLAGNDFSAEHVTRNVVLTCPHYRHTHTYANATHAVLMFTVTIAPVNTVLRRMFDSLSSNFEKITDAFHMTLINKRAGFDFR